MSPAQPSSKGIEQLPFELTHADEPGRIVRGRVCLPAGGPAREPLAWVLLLHGFKGFMDWGFFPTLGRRLAQGGVASVAFNASGSGIGPDLESFSELAAFRRDTLSRQLEDIERVRASALSGQLGPLSKERRGLFGHSRGAALGIVHAAEDGGYRAVATWAALDDFDRWDAATKQVWRRDGVLGVLNARTGQELPVGIGFLDDLEAHAARFDVRAAAASLEAPLFMLHGEADEVVSSAASRALFSLARRPAHLGILQGQGHALGAVHPLRDPSADLDAALRQTIDWLCATLAP